MAIDGYCRTGRLFIFLCSREITIKLAFDRVEKLVVIIYLVLASDCRCELQKIGAVQMNVISIQTMRVPEENEAFVTLPM